MSMNTLAKLLHELLKDVKLLQARAREEGLPGAVTPERAAELLGCSLKSLRTEIRCGRIRTVPVGNRQYVPMSEIVGLRRPGARAPLKVKPKEQRRSTEKRAGSRPRKRRRPPKGRGGTKV